MEQCKETEQLAEVSRDWGYGIAGYRMQQLSRTMEHIAKGYEDIGTKATDSWHGILLRESRRMLAEQYRELSEMLSELSNGFADGVGQSRELRDQIKERLAQEGIRVRQIIFVPVKDKRKEVHLVARVMKGSNRLVEEVAQMLSGMLAQAYVPAEGSGRILGREYGYFVFHRKERYRMVTGAVCASKKVGEPSGDNYVILRPCFGEGAFAISDGMGTGEKASRESRFVVELLEHFLLAGFRRETMVSLLNSVLLLSGEGQSYATVDLCLLNLFDGTATFVKSGAATAFIKRDEWVEMIDESGLPVGMLPEVRPSVSRRTLHPGECILLMSDGVMECFTGEKDGDVRRVLQNMKSGTPQDMAGALLLLALKKNNYEPKDDMTVVAVRLEKNSEDGEQ